MIDGWMDGLRGGDGWMMDEQMNTWVDKCRDELTDGQMGGWKDDGQMDG